MNEGENKTKSTRTIKIIVPVLIAVVIAGIFILKNSRDRPAPDVTGDFALEAEEIDLKQLKSHGLPIMIDFGADSCQPCVEMAPVLRELNKELQGKAIIKFVDLWKNRDAAADFPIQAIPTQFFFDEDGNPYVPEDPQAMQMMMYSMRDTEEHVYTAHQGAMTKEQIMDVLKEMGVE